MLTWQDFAVERPDLAEAGRALLYPYEVGLGFLATTRRDGGPRVHPICPLLSDEGVHAFIVPGPKLADLRRDPRYALHSETFPPPRHDDALYLTGVVREVDDGDLRARLQRQMLAERHLAEPWPGFDDQVLVELLVETCLVTMTAPAFGLEAGHTVWHAPAAVA